MHLYHAAASDKSQERMLWILARQLVSARFSRARFRSRGVSSRQQLFEVGNREFVEAVKEPKSTPSDFSGL
jgi:hypothetical protein